MMLLLDIPLDLKELIQNVVILKFHNYICNLLEITNPVDCTWFSRDALSEKLCA